jgi:hypothetical protein
MLVSVQLIPMIEFLFFEISFMSLLLPKILFRFINLHMITMHSLNFILGIFFLRIRI